MSFPSAKSTNLDIIKDNPNVNDKPVKSVRKIFSGTPVKSRIPKHGKLHTPTMDKDASSVDNDAPEKQDEEPPTPIPRPLSKSQDKPPIVNVRIRSSLSMGSDSCEKRVLENKFNQKKTRFISLTRDIKDKQKLSVTSFKELFQLREKILHLGGKDPGKLDDMNLLGSWFINNRVGDCSTENSGSGSEKLISQIETNLSVVIQSLLEFCREALEKRKDIVVWLTNFEREYWDDPSLLNCKEKMSHQSKSYKLENVAFEKRLDSIRQEQFLRIKELALSLSFMWQECQIYHEEMTVGDCNAVQTVTNEEHLKELRLEKEKSLKIRAKLREQENALANAEKKLRSSQDNIKQLETQLKQKEVNIESKTKELVKCQKFHETALGKSEKLKETLESRLIKLKEEVELKENEEKNIRNAYEEKLENLDYQLENERKRSQELEFQFDEFKIRYTKLEEKCKELLGVQEKRKDISLDNHHTEYEIQLFTDLKETKNILAEKEKLIQRLQIERNEIIEAVNEDQENISSNKRLTADILKKSNELQTLKSQFAQLQKNYKRMQQKAEHLEDKLADMNRMQTQLKDGNRNVYNVQVMQLQQEVTDLRSALTDVNLQNDELEKNCMQLQLKLEHYKRYMRNQDKDYKVRQEMQQLLQHNDDGYLDSVDQNTFNSINSDEFQQLYATLENKEMQVMKLEKLVKQMEKQEEHSQVQRTRLENRIAKLEVALKEGQQAHRNRGFSFL